MVEQEEFGHFSRRSLLLGSAAWAISQALLGCGQQDSTALTVDVLRSSIPPQLLQQIRQQLKQVNPPAALNVLSETQLQTLFSQLQRWQQSPSQPSPPTSASLDQFPLLGRAAPRTPDLVTLGDFWLPVAVRQGLLQPFSESDRAGLSSWGQVVKISKLAELVLQNAQGQADPQGQVWGIPYRLGSTVIAYRRDLLAKRGLKPPVDWADLWRPEFRGRISLLNQPREVIGLTLKRLGKSYNTTDLATVPDLKPTLQSLNQQVKFYSSDTYLQPLMLEDTWIAVGWSLDVLPLGDRLSKIAAVIPASGTALSAELWVRPKSAETTFSTLAKNWVDFWWQPAIAAQLSQLTWGLAPTLLNAPPEQFPTELRQNPLLFPDGKVLQASEFLRPLPETSVQQYQQYWAEMRSLVASTAKG